MSVEVSAVCNLKRSFCVRPLWKSKKDFMSVGEVYKIIDFCQPYLGEKSVINLTGLGEPLLNPNIVEIISVVKGFGFPVELNTNCLLLGDALAESEIDRVVCSLRFFDRDFYESCCGFYYDRVYENVQDFLGLKKRPSVSLQVFADQDVDGFRSFWKPYLRRGDAFMLSPYLPMIQWFEGKTDVRIKSCPQLNRTITVNVMGEFLPCCFAAWFPVFDWKFCENCPV